jgi:hypothetical protein
LRIDHIALVGRDRPSPRRFVVDNTLNRRAELNILAQIELVGGVVEPPFDFRLAGKALAPAPTFVGSKVPVRYDPHNPADAVLELGQTGAGNNLLAGILLMLIGIGGVAFTVFSVVTPSS